jgi:hypothetical protein
LKALRALRLVKVLKYMTSLHAIGMVLYSSSTTFLSIAMLLVSVCVYRQQGSCADAGMMMAHDS